MTKRFFLALFAISLVALSAVAEDKQAEAKFEVKSHDFGTIKEADGPVEWGDRAVWNEMHHSTPYPYSID